MKITPLLVILIVLTASIVSQSAQAALAQRSGAGTGLKLESEASYRARDHLKMVRTFSGNLPSQVDLASDFPMVGNQGAQASCVAWALAYAVKTAHEHRELGWDMKNANHVFSPAYLYNQINNGRDDGASIDEGIHTIRKTGAVPLTVMPYDDLDYTTKPTKDQLALGSNFTIGEYRRVAEKNVDELKHILASGEPVVMAIKLYPAFMGDEIRKTAGIYATTGGDHLTDHAITLVGYDDGKKAFRFMNSWGSSWGDNGFGWLTYEFLPQVALRAYAVYDTPTPKKVKRYLARFSDESVEDYDFAGGDPEQFHRTRVTGDRKQVTRKAAPKKVASPPAAPSIEPFYLVPEERGIKINDTWLRIGDPMTKAKQAMTSKPLAESDLSLMYDDERGRTIFMAEPRSGKIGQILFLHGMTSKSSGETNRGLRIGDAKHDAHRIYGKPDVTTVGNDAYFYEAVAEDYGGLAWEKHITLLVDYDGDAVRSLKLLETDKGAMTGSYLKESSREDIAEARDITFHVPEDFEDIKKSEWKDIGYGYFTRSRDGQTTITVKVFDLTGKDAPKTMEAFSKKDLSAIPSMMKIGAPEKKSWGGLTWKAYTISSNFGGPSIRAYALSGDRMFSIVITAPNKAWYDGSEAKQFFGSIAVK